MSTNSSPFTPLVEYTASLANWPVSAARSNFEQQADLCEKTLALTAEPTIDHMQDAADAARACLSTALSAPFDAMRAQYAASVRAGVIARSMLGWREFERKLVQMEKLALGPLAREH
ncbi:hypothetical protein [Derxia gummosa]|uniref:Phasin protein n=1 Tax=Derxia gummosa DSM 723 TaxID=1121388 RepID=A0A8B6X8K6_9BURK|nr:hypothetical protein [Derxia gummosa]